MANLRLVARLDVKAPNLIKGIHLEGLRVIGDPAEHARRYYDEGADELIYMDVVASLYGRNSLSDLIRRTSADVFIPITVGGGIRSVEDATEALRAGADKVAVNTAAIANPQLVTDIARRFGSQCMVLSVEAKQVGPGKWEAYTDNGRERTGLDVVEWVRRGVAAGAGEILLTSVDREGTAKGFDVALVAAVTSAVAVPVIASGGMGSFDHLAEVVEKGHADAVAMAHVLHYKKSGLGDIRAQALARNFPVRRHD